MSKVAIVTDSTAYLPAKYVEDLNIKVIPLQVVWGQETFRDGIDIQPSAFYNRLQISDTMPTTSQPSAANFKSVFESLLADGFDVLAILISSELSGTVASAEQAKLMLPNATIEIIDSKCTTSELCFHVIEAGRAVADGADLETCKHRALSARQRSGVVFAVDTLEFLHKGGRIGGARRLLGTVLNIKPILELKDGRIDAVEQVRTRRKARNRLLELVQERTQGNDLQFLGVSHASAPEDASELLGKAQDLLFFKETLLVDLSPVIGTHVGPGTLSIAYMVEE